MLECANILRLEGLDEVPLDDGCEPWEKSFSPTPEFILEKNRWIWYLYTTAAAAAAAAILIANFFLFSARDLLLLLLLLCASTLRGYEGVPLRGQPNVCPRCLGSFFFFFFFEKEQNRIYF
jgi:hypothetical protein